MDRISGWLERRSILELRWQIPIVLGFVVAGAAIVLSGDERVAWVVGQRVHQPVTARVDFARVNEIATKEAKQRFQRTTPNYYRLNTPLLEEISGQLRELAAAVQASDDFARFSESKPAGWRIDAAGFDALKALTAQNGGEAFEQLVRGVVERLRVENLVQRPAATERDAMSQNSEHEILVRGPEPRDEHVVSKQRLSYVTNEDHVVRLAKDLSERFPGSLRPTVTDIIVRAIRVEPQKERYQPVYVFDRERTQKALDGVNALPPEFDRFKQGEVLVGPGAVMTPELIALVNQEHEAFIQGRLTDPDLRGAWLARRFGQAGIVFLITLTTAIYVARYQKRVVRNAARGLAIASLLLLMMLLARLIALGGRSDLWAATTVATAAAILTIAYSERFALGLTAVLSLLTTLTLHGPLSLFLVLMAAGATTVFFTGDVRTRLKLIQVGVVAGMATAATQFVVGLTQGQSMVFLAGQAAIAATAGLLACSAVLVLLPVIERVFRISTAMTLLEWADASKPLLKQLIQKAPGTWQHSHLLGSMAEAAADEIGANGLLCRVGAYYHDIGKMCKPEYFVENQGSQPSMHRRLAPRMSMLVILGHVKDGLALARDYGLPPVLHQFIAEHHGTTVVKYFHALASQDRARNGADDRDLDDSDFRYPGPRPTSRETAILMLCDSVEGAVRSLTEPTPARIESIVHEIAMQRLMDGQLDDCEITLRELSRIEQSLIKSLCSIYHGRIAYPKEPAVAQTRSA